MNSLHASLYSRYNRQILLPEIGSQGQLSLLNASVLVVGAGGLGCPVLQYLAAAGVGRIGIIDFDIVEESNLQRQVLFSTSDIGCLKVEAAATKLSQLNPSILIKTYPVKLTSDNALQIIKDYDLVVDGSDNFPARFLVNDSCILLNKPFVFGAIYQYEGQVSVFNYKDGPTYRCMVPEYPDSSQALNCSEIGVLGVVTGIIGSLMACEAIKIITGIGDTLSGRLLTVDTRSMQFNSIKIEKDKAQHTIIKLADYHELCNANNNSPGVASISSTELKSKLSAGENVMLIDIRDEREFSEYSIPGSINVPFRSVESFINQTDPSYLVVLVCSLGIKSAEIIRVLNQAKGKFKVSNLEGGIAGWMVTESISIHD